MSIIHHTMFVYFSDGIYVRYFSCEVTLLLCDEGHFHSVLNHAQHSRYDTCLSVCLHMHWFLLLLLLLRLLLRLLSFFLTIPFSTVSFQFNMKLLLLLLTHHATKIIMSLLFHNILGIWPESKVPISYITRLSNHTLRSMRTILMMA